jgi:hypothetical protein
LCHGDLYAVRVGFVPKVSTAPTTSAEKIESRSDTNSRPTSFRIERRELLSQSEVRDNKVSAASKGREQCLVTVRTSSSMIVERFLFAPKYQ